MTETDLKLAQDLLSFMEKIVVGATAIVAGLASQWFVNKWTKERDRERLLREKAAELVKVIFKHQNRTMSNIWRTSTSNPGFEEPDPLYEIEALCRIYFSSLDEERVHYHQATHQLVQRHIDLLRQSNGSPIPADEPSMSKLIAHYLEACKILLRAATRHASPDAR